MSGGRSERKSTQVVATDLGEQQASDDSTRGRHMAGGNMVEWRIIDRLGGGNDGHEGGKLGIEEG